MGQVWCKTRRGAVGTESPSGIEIAGYRIESVLGRGGMGVVYLAEQAFPRRKVALKVLHPDLASEAPFRERFIRESNAAASLEHPNIVPIYEAGESGGALYIAMRHINGTDLKALLAREGPLPPHRVAAIVSLVAEALDAAHDRGLVHRDVKPGNVLVAESPGIDHVYVTDFGLIKPRGEAPDLTQTGQFVGTADYVAPEQIQGKDVDGRADVYALGCLLYECLAGAPPFPRDNEAAVLYAHLRDSPPGVTAARPELPLALDEVVARAMAKRPEDRFPTAGAMAAAVREALAPEEVPQRARPAPRRAAPIIGREFELAQLLAALDEVESGRGQTVFVAGEPGIGKSRLAAEVAERARPRARVLWGPSWEAAGSPPYWPWVQCLRSYLRDEEADGVPPLEPESAALVAELVPELRRRLPNLPTAPPLELEGARFRLFDAVASFLLSAGRSRPLLLILDDLHAADAPSLVLLTHVSRAIRDGRVMLLGCYRDTQIVQRQAFATALGDITRQGGATVVSLSGLSEDEVAGFLEATMGAVPDRSLVAVVQEQAAGNPLFVGEVAHILLGHERRPARALIPRGVGQAIDRRLGLISPRCRDLLAAASVLGRDFGIPPLRRLTDIERGELLALLDEATDARLLEEVPDAVGRWRFSHGLVRDALYAHLGPSERVKLHQRAGAALEALHKDDPDPHLAEIAYHFVRAAAAGDPALAVDYARRAGDRALRVLAYEEAAGLYETALEALDLEERVDPSERCDLLLAAGEAWSRAGQHGAFQGAFRRAAEVARRNEMPERLARAALGYGGRAVWARPGGDPNVIPLLEEALAAVGETDPVLRARLMARLAGALRDQPAPERRERLSADAVELARRAGDPATLAWALTGRRLVLWGPGRPDEALALCDELVGLAEQSADPERVVEAHTLRLESRLTIGDMAGVREDLHRAAGAADTVPLPSVRWHILVHRAELALLEGRFDDAEDAVAQGRTELSWDDTGDAAASLVALEFLLLRERGRGAEIVADLESLAREHRSTRPLFRCLHADACAELGRESEARAAFEPLAVSEFGAIPRDLGWMLCIALLCRVAAFLGDARRSSTLHDLLLPFEDLNVIDPHEFSAGSAARYLGLLDEVLGREDEAVQHLERALRMNEAMGARPWVAHAQYDLARVLLGRDPADRERAEELLDRSLAQCQSLGMSGLEARIAALPQERPTRAPTGSRPWAQSVFHREGEYWSIAFEGQALRLHDSKGLHHLARLLAEPGREIHALDLVGAEEGPEPERGLIGDAGEILDPKARAAYRARLEELREELEEAESWHDPERAARAREEMEFLAHELAGAVGLGGRDRRAASAAERARVNVTRAIKAALGRIAEHSPALGRHLESAIRTGTFCSYSPDPRLPITWQL